MVIGCEKAVDNKLHDDCFLNDRAGSAFDRGEGTDYQDRLVKITALCYDRIAQITSSFLQNYGQKAKNRYDIRG